MMNYNTILDKIKDKKYTTKLPFPTYSASISVIDRNALKTKYNEDSARLKKVFMLDLREYANNRLGTVSDKQFDDLFNKAWEDGHSGGFATILEYFDSLIEFIEIFVKDTLRPLLTTYQLKQALDLLVSASNKLDQQDFINIWGKGLGEHIWRQNNNNLISIWDSNLNQEQKNKFAEYILIKKFK